MRFSMNDRLKHLPTTIPGIAVIAFLALAVYLERSLLQNPATLIALGVGIAGILGKGKN